MKLKTMVLNKLRSDLGRDATWTFTCQIAVMLCMLIINKILSNTLTIEDYGQFNIIRRSSSVLSFVILGGMGIALPRYLPYYQSKKCFFSLKNIIVSSFFVTAFLAIIVAFVCFFFRSTFSELFIGTQEIELYYIVIFYSFSCSLCSLVYAYYRGMSQFKAFNISQLVYQIIVTLPLLLLIPRKVSLLFYLWSFIGIGFAIMLSGYEIFKYHMIIFKRIQYKYLLKSLKILSCYSFPRLVGDFLLFSLNAFPLIYIGSKSGLISTSFFSVGVSLVSIVTPVFSILGIVLLPYVSKLVAKGGIHEAANTIIQIRNIYLVIAVLMSLFFIVFTQYMIILFFSADYLSAVRCSRILILSVIPSSLYYLYRNPIDGASEFPYNTFILLTCIIIMAVLFYISDSIEEYAWAFFCVMAVKGLSSYLVWQLILKKNNK